MSAERMLSGEDLRAASEKVDEWLDEPTPEQALRAHVADLLTDVDHFDGCKANNQPACAATGPKPPAPKPYKPQPKPAQRTTSKVQDRPRATAPKPTNWAGYNDRVRQRNWTSPYRSGYPAAPQPVVIHQYGNDYRTYPGYVGYYPVGIWPVGYGDRYGCSAEREGEANR